MLAASLFKQHRSAADLFPGIRLQCLAYRIEIAAGYIVQAAQFGARIFKVPVPIPEDAGI